MINSGSTGFGETGSREPMEDKVGDNDPESLAMPGVRWGRPDVLFTPAYWQSQLQWCPSLQRAGAHRLGESFREEVVACLLGGHGIPAEIGLAAFAAIRSSGLLSPDRRPTEEDIYSVLGQPLPLTSGKRVRYRFAKQKSGYVAIFLASREQAPSDDSHATLRNWLVNFDGIGLKTASWAIRNWFDSDHVAILDIHIHRAGLLAGVFNASHSLSRSYLEMERRFLDFCGAINARPSALDALIWWQMRRAGNLATQGIFP